MEKITIESKKIIQEYNKTYQIKASELVFTNLFAWREKYGFHFIIDHDYLWIVNDMKDRLYFSQPIGDYSHKEDLLATIRLIYNTYGKFTIKKCDEQFKAFAESHIKDCHIEDIRDDYDYIYDFNAIKDLKGKINHKKKNHINKFLKSYQEWSFETMTSTDFNHVIEICEDWFEKDNDEYSAIKDVVNHLDQLDCTGGILRINSKPVAFIIGERMTDDTLVIHFEKAIKGYYGLYQMVLNEYLKAYDNIKYLNREQDLGIPGLRKAKLSYHPIDFIKKYNISIESI